MKKEGRVRKRKKKNTAYEARKIIIKKEGHVRYRKTTAYETRKIIIKKEGRGRYRKNTASEAGKIIRASNRQRTVTSQQLKDKLK